MAKVSRVCRYCNQPFEIEASRVKDGNRGKYCSRTCWREAVSLEKYLDLNCATCGKRFSIKKSSFELRAKKGKTPKYCSPACAHLAHGRDISRFNNITRDLLYSLYIEQGLSLDEIATKLELPPESGKSISNLLRKFGIPTRTRSEAYKNSVEKGKTPASFKAGYTPWNKGVTARDDERIAHGKGLSDIIKSNLANPLTRKKISQAHAGKPKSQEHRRNISKGRKGIIFSPEHIENIRKATLNQKPVYRDTSIERIVQGKLRELGLEFETHKNIHNICRPDIVFSEQKLAIFCDGMYWHSKSRVAEKDRRQEKEITAKGWRYLRFTDSEINNTPDKCIQAIIKELAGHRQ